MQLLQSRGSPGLQFFATGAFVPSNVSTLSDVDDDYVLGLETPSRGWSAITRWSLVLSWVRG